MAGVPWLGYSGKAKWTERGGNSNVNESIENPDRVSILSKASRITRLHIMNNYIIDDNTPRRLADTIARLISGHNNGIRSSDYIRETVAGFSWSHNAQSILVQYQEMLRMYARSIEE